MISLQTNVDSINAQTNLGVDSNFQSKTIQQLTSGYRINSSADDAAGLAVANGYRNQIAELTQGINNANNGVSQMQIIDGGISNISTILDRLKTLATQSASDTFTGNRATLNQEYSSLLGELDRQANNIGLGNTDTGNAKNLQIYLGGGQSANTNSSVSVDLLGKSIGSIGLGLSGTSVLTTAPTIVGGNAAAPIPAGKADSFTINTASGATTFSITGQSGDTLQGQINGLNGQLASLGMVASIDPVSGKLQIQSSTAFTVSARSNGTANDLVDFGAANIAANSGFNVVKYSAVTATDVLSITVGSTTARFTVPAGGLSQPMITSLNQSLQAQGISGVTAVQDTTATAVSLQGAGAFTASVTPAAGGGGSLGTLTPAVAGGGNPTAAINIITQAVQVLGSVSGIVGAGENQLSYAINLANAAVANLSAAQSSIRDANIAQQAANLTKSQVLTQTSIAALAQANSEPQSVLKLLQQ